MGRGRPVARPGSPVGLAGRTTGHITITMFTKVGEGDRGTRTEGSLKGLERKRRLGPHAQLQAIGGEGARIHF